MFIENNYNSVVPKMNTVNKSHMETRLYTKKYLLVRDLHAQEVNAENSVRTWDFTYNGVIVNLVPSPNVYPKYNRIFTIFDHFK